MVNGSVVLEGRNLTKVFAVRQGMIKRTRIKAVDNVSLRLHEREVLAIIGESGAGKTTLARMLVNIVKPDLGDVIYRGRLVREMKRRELAREIQYVFQDPFSSIPPNRNVEALISEVVSIHRLAEGRGDKRERVREALHEVGLTPVEDFMRKFPHEMSGGQRQRLAFARALVVRPKVLIADEPVSMLDVSIRASILELMGKLAKELGISIVYVTHDITTAKLISDNALVMYRGKVVESGPMREVVENPLHPYTSTLISSLPELAKGGISLRGPEGGKISGLRPRIEDLKVGKSCVFADKCPYVMNACTTSEPELKEVGGGHRVACLLYGS